MADGGTDQPGRPRRASRPAGPASLAALVLALAALVLALAACGGREPQVTVSNLNWACGAQRCSAELRLTAGRDDESVVVRVRAYAGESVADREIVGEYFERMHLRAGQSRRLAAVVETSRPATRVRVIVQRAD